jgi:hypothetical protein
MWIRIRNLYLDLSRAPPQPLFSAQNILIAGKVAPDTHIVPLLPYFRWVVSIVLQF